MFKASKKNFKIILIIAVVIITLGSISAFLLYFVRQKAEDETVASFRSFSDNLSLVKATSSFLGYSEPKTYLFVLQNSDEMRPTGGFIGTYGFITLDAGHITDFFTDDVYNLDKLAPEQTRPSTPEPIKKYLEQSYWYLRDANWSPDFPTSAEQILRFYKEESAYIPEDRKQKTEDGNPSSVLRPQSSDIDGVIAIMPEAIRSLFEIVGPITISGQTFSAENLTDALEYEVEVGFARKGIVHPQRKAIVSELGHELIARVTALSAKSWPEVLHRIRTAFDEKHIILYASDAEIQKIITAHGWAGIVAPSATDYLAVYDANMFSMKTDPYVPRSIFYKIYWEGQALLGETEIVYSYPKSGPAWKTKGYRSWTRVYVPKGSILQKAFGALEQEQIPESGSVSVAQEFGKTVFGAFVAVQVGETKRLKFIYRLPDYVLEAVTNGKYELMVQKQPGTLGHELTVSVDFDKVPKAWTPTGLNARLHNTQLIWATRLNQDLNFYVGL